MGMDWVVLDKEEGGRKVDAWETLGARRLNKADPETVEAFRQRYESNRAALAARPRRRSLLQRAFELLGDVSEEEKQRRYWERPFEEVLDDAASQSPPPVMIYASEEN